MEPIPHEIEIDWGAGGQAAPFNDNEKVSLSQAVGENVSAWVNKNGTPKDEQEYSMLQAAAESAIPEFPGEGWEAIVHVTFPSIGGRRWEGEDSE